MTIQEQLLGGHFHHATQGSGQGRLPAAHRSHHGHQFTCFDLETQSVEGVGIGSVVADVQVAGLKLAAHRLIQMFRLRGVADQRFACEQFLDAFQAHLSGLERVEREAEQSGGKHQALHIKDQGDQPADGQSSLLQLTTPERQKQQQGDGRDPLQQRKQGAAGSRQFDRGIAIAAVPGAESVKLLSLLAVNLDGCNA